MKPMGESPEVFAAYAAIDANYYVIRRLTSEVLKPRSPIEVMVDQQTGFDPTFQQAEQIAECLRSIIEAKKLIEGDSQADETLLLQISNVFPSLNTK